MYKYVKVQDTTWVDYDNNNELLVLPTVVSVKQMKKQVEPEADEFLYSGDAPVDALQIYVNGKFYNSIQDMRNDTPA